MSESASKSITICGTGLAGALLACYLGRQGHRVTLFERRADPRAAGYVGGRSINLALSARGLWGLDGVGLKNAVLAHAIPMRGRVMHAPERNPKLVFQPYSKDSTDAINSISRGGLNLALIKAAATFENVRLVFNHRCVDVDLDRCTATFVDESAGEHGPTVTVKSDLIIGADGAFSAVRARMQKSDRYEYHQSFLGHGYKELHIPPVAGGGGPHGGYALEPNALHIWPRGSAMMIALPNPDKSFTCTLFWPFEGEHSFASLDTPEKIRAFFERHYPDAVPLMPTLVEDFLANPVGSLVTVKAWPWVTHSAAGSVALIGDAAHAIVPFYGQGMNAAFEDVRVLAELLEQRDGDVGDALDRYQAVRKPNADAIAKMAVENFVEMRDKVGSRWFRLRKHVEHALHALMPSTLAPRYNLVSFSTVPYTRAMAQGVRLSRVITGLLIAASVIVLCAILAAGVWLMGMAR